VFEYTCWPAAATVLSNADDDDDDDFILFIHWAIILLRFTGSR